MITENMTVEEITSYLFGRHAPDFNFEKDENEIRLLAMDKGLVVMYLDDNDKVRYRLTNKYKQLMGVPV